MFRIELEAAGGLYGKKRFQKRNLGMVGRIGNGFQVTEEKLAVREREALRIVFCELFDVDQVSGRKNLDDLVGQAEDEFAQAGTCARLTSCGLPIEEAEGMQMHFDFCIGRKARVEFVLACVFVVIAIVQAEVEFFRRKRAAEADVDDARVMANSGWVNVANGGDAFVRNRTEDRFSDVPHSLSAGRAIEQADQMFIKVLVGPITGICYPVDEDVNLSFVWVRWCLLNRCEHICVSNLQSGLLLEGFIDVEDR